MSVEVTVVEQPILVTVDDGSPVEITVSNISQVSVSVGAVATGIGVPVGGTTGQQLTKKTGTDYDTEWSSPQFPVGVDKEVQFNDGGVIGAASDFKFDKKTEEFQAFVKKFSFEFFNYMPGTYTDKKKQFRIKIVEEITDTPARYASVADVIEVSKAAFDLVSVPIRTILISHEYAHKAMNRNIDDEFEADINSLKLFSHLFF